jgi:hypothetical protein
VAVLLAGSVIGLVLLRRARDAAPEPRPALPADLPAPNPVDQETLRRALADVQD